MSAGLPIVASAAVVALTLLKPTSYVATASFMPQGIQQREMALTDLVSQLGFIAGPNRDDSPAFYADLLRSREILERAILTRYSLRVDAGSIKGDLLESFDVTGEPSERMAEALQELDERLTITTQPTGVVELSVSAQWPALAEQICARLLTLINNFNLEQRQSQAEAERRFVEGRLSALRGELHSAEEQLKTFLQQNRNFENSPQLQFEYDRLLRQVQLRQQVVTELSTSYEDAKIAEVRNTPVITVIEEPQGSARPAPRRTILKGVLAFVLVCLLVLLAASGWQRLVDACMHDREGFQEYRRLRAKIGSDLRGPLRRLRGKSQLNPAPREAVQRKDSR